MNGGHARQRQIAVTVPDHGTEVLWGEDTGDSTCRILSVPVFAFGLSRGSLVLTRAGGGSHLVLDHVLRESEGATVRCYTAPNVPASRLYLTQVIPGAEAERLSLGPATFFDPDIVAIHVRNRTELSRVASYLDRLVRAGVLQFWELADPPRDLPEDSEYAEAWELVHPPPGDDGSTSVST